MRPLTFRLFLLTIACGLLVSSGAMAGPERPNIVYILADDMGYGDPHFAGGKASTPNLDRLAAEGMRFTDAHTSSSVCTPTRYGILTGRYNWRSRLKKGVLGGLSPALIRSSRPTVATLLKEAGYETAIVGKWHLGLDWEKLAEPRQAESGPTNGPGWKLDYSQPVRNGPTTLGFGESFVISASLDMSPFVYLKNDKAVAIPTVTKTFVRPGPASAKFEADQCLRDFAREARSFIGKPEEEKPFFLYLPLTSPHTPIVPSEAWQGKSAVGKYGDFLMETDWVVGEVLAELEAQGVEDETLIVLTSDNGCSPTVDISEMEELGHRPNGSWRGAKADIWEGGHREPFVVRWPGIVEPGSVCAATICTTDLFATVADILGKASAIPAHAAEDSFSILPLLKGEEGYQRKFTIHHSINGSFAIRQGDWKLCLCPGSGGWSSPRPDSPAAASLYPVQLFNLEDDPGEANNLAEQFPGRVEELAGLFEKAVREGRTTAGASQTNEGKGFPIPNRVVELLPLLKEMTVHKDK